MHVPKCGKEVWHSFDVQLCRTSLTTEKESIDICPWVYVNAH